MTVVVAGEALIDLAPRGELLLPLPGGSPYNVAIGLGRLSTPAEYLGRLSSDGFGQRLRSRLEAEGIGLDLLVHTDDPTTLAVVHLDEQARASYAFYLANTSATGLTDELLPQPDALPAGAALHVSFGALGLEDPAGRALGQLLERTAGSRVRSLDPNVRPSVISDLPRYTKDMDALVSSCDLVKVSDEDLAFLHPTRDPLEVAAQWATTGPALVVVTCGPDGAHAFDPAGGSVAVPGRDVEVVDTVGAGDAFTAGLLSWLHEHGYLDAVAELGRLTTEGRTTDALAAAVEVAALTCTRAGSDPPTRDELAAFSDR